MIFLHALLNTWVVVFAVFAIGFDFIRRDKIEEEGSAPHFLIYMLFAFVMSIAAPFILLISLFVNR